jgi:hypothetical protein
MKEALMPDGSITQVHDEGTIVIEGNMAVIRWQLISAVSGIRMYLKSGGRMEVRKGYTKQAVEFIAAFMGDIPPEDLVECGRGKFTGYPRSPRGKQMALEDGEWLIDCFNAAALVVETEE